MTDHEVERRLGYTPCVCGVIDGTWHNECYRGKTDSQIKDGYRKAFAKARRHLKAIDDKATSALLARAAGQKETEG